MVDREMGMRIRRQRELLGYTREELAEKINVSPKFCSDIEIGARGVSIETLCKISKELMITTDYILFGREDLEIDEEFNILIKMCSKKNAVYLKNIIRSFIRACNENEE